MKKIILYTNMSSIKKHWQNALQDEYSIVNLKDYKKLIEYITLNQSSIMLLLDELSVKSILEAIEELSFHSHASLLLFNARPEVHHASTLLSTSIKGYENSYLDKGNLLQMLESVQNGKQWLFADLTNYIISKFIQERAQGEPEFMSILTIKEKEIALMIADGYTNKEIVQAEKLALSTVKGHICKIFEKAGVTDRVSLVLKFR